MKKLGITLSVIAFSASHAYAVDFNELPLSGNAKTILNSQWGLQYESNSTRAWKFPFRLLGRPLKRLLDGKIGQGVGATLRIPYDMLHSNRQGLSTLYRSSLGTLVTPLSFVSEAISDVASAGKVMAYANLPESPRIQVCGFKFPFLPFEHIFFTADLGEIHNDRFDIYKSRGLVPEGESHVNASAYCFKVPIQSKESPSLAIERLSCMTSVSADVDFDFFTYNCGGMTRAEVKAAGLTFPDISNLGIGSNMSSVPQIVKDQFKTQKVTCDGYIDSLRNMIFELEKGNSIHQDDFQRLLSFHPRKDAILQFIISAQRGKNPQNVALVHDTLVRNQLDQELENYMPKDDSLTGTFNHDKRRVHKYYRKTVRKMLNALSPDDLTAVEARYPILKLIQEDLKKWYFRF